MEQKFWNWFSENAELYFNFESDQDRLFDDLNKKLNEIDKNLTFEFGPIFENGKRDFVISADGIKQSFPNVTKLVNCAPIFDKFIIMAFRQPHLDHSIIYYKDIQLDFKDVFFRFGKDNGKIGIEFNIKNYQESIDWTTAIYILLDTVLGEYNAEMNLSWIERKKLDEEEISNLYQIIELPKIMDDYKKEIQN